MKYVKKYECLKGLLVVLYTYIFPVVIHSRLQTYFLVGKCTFFIRLCWQSLKEWPTYNQIRNSHQAQFSVHPEQNGLVANKLNEKIKWMRLY